MVRVAMETTPSSAAQTSPAVTRNREPILAVLRGILPIHGTVLEVASGTGEHATFFAKHLPHLIWQPTDPDPVALASIAAHRAAANLGNLRVPLQLDVTAPDWPLDKADAVVAINMIHISPWTAAQGLMAGAARLLPAAAALYLYGPFKDNGAHTAPSNAAFDANLRARDPRWGVRDIGDVVTLADEYGFDFIARVPMPANNLSVVFRRRLS